jgi:hypothetical protein
MSLLSFLGVGCSTIELPAGPEGIRLEISLEQTSRRGDAGRPADETDQVTVVLYNAKGRAIENGAVRMLVNDVELPFRVGQGNYYDRHPYYQLRDSERLRLAPDAEYRFTLVWRDGTRYEAATIRTPKAITLASVALPHTSALGAPLTVRWTDVPTTAELVAYRTRRLVDSAGNVGVVSGSRNMPDALRRKIGRGFLRGASGSMTIPGDYLRELEGQPVTALGVEVSAATTGTVSKPFLPKSTVTALRRIETRVEIGGGGEDG